MNDLSPDRHDKFKAYRARKKAAGLREMRMWVPDAQAPGFQERLDRDIVAINKRDKKSRDMNWVEAASAEVWQDAD